MSDDPFARFADLSDEAIRKNIAEHVYGEDNKRRAEAVLASRDQLRREASQAEQMDIARSAKDAAWEAAKAARSANTRATIALVTATVSAIATGIMAYLAWTHPPH